MIKLQLNLQQGSSEHLLMKTLERLAGPHWWFMFSNLADVDRGIITVSTRQTLSQAFTRLLTFPRVILEIRPGQADSTTCHADSRLKILDQRLSGLFKWFQGENNISGQQLRVTKNLSIKFAAQLIFDCLNFIQFWHVLSEDQSHNDKVPIRMQDTLTNHRPETDHVTSSQPIVYEWGLITMQNWFPTSHQDPGSSGDNLVISWYSSQPQYLSSFSTLRSTL